MLSGIYLKTFLNFLAFSKEFRVLSPELTNQLF